MTAENKKKLVLFDFDGVLVNTTDLGFVIQKKYNPHITKEFYNSLSEGNFIENYTRAVADGLIDDITEWEEHYGKELEKITTHSVIAHMVCDLAKEYMLCVVSSTTSGHIIRKLEQENIRDCFQDICGADVHRSKVVKIKMLLEKYSVEPSNAIFITDTLGDVREGNECNVKSIGVTWGSHDRDTLNIGNPFAVVDDVVELEVAVQKFFDSQK